LSHTYSVFLGGPLLLDASASFDTAGLALSYAWDLNLDGVYGDVIGIRPTVTTDQFIADFPLPGSYGFALKVTNSAGQSNVSFATLVVGDHVPVANPGGPYTVRSGTSITLDGSGSFDIDPGDSISYAWDLNNDGIFSDSSLVRPSVTFEGSVGSVSPVCLKVTDLFARNSTGCTTVTVVLAAVPEPGSAALLACGMAWMCLSALRRSKFGRRTSHVRNC
jgi:hypothetical protein